jgi:hypothetical protein
MKPTKKYRKIKKYKSKKHKRKFIGGRDKDPIQISDTTGREITYARPDMKSFKTLDPSIIDADRKVSCDGVKDNVTLLNKLQGYDYFKLNKPMTLVLFPYCNEEIRQRQLVPSSIADAVDLVNRPLLDALSMNAFIKAFSDDKNKFQFEYNSLTPPLTIELDKESNTKYIASPPTNAPLFIKTLKDYIAENLDRKKKGIFIVSHSGFMTNLMMELLKMEQGEFGAPNLHTDQYQGQLNIAFDNLDIIHIQYDKNQKLFLNITIRRRVYKYNINPVGINEPREIDIQSSLISSEDDSPILNIFIMRHCLACHNLSSSISEKAIQYFANRKGYLNYSLCLRKTCIDLQLVKKELLDLFKTYCFFNKSPNFSEILFGSSVIFRAILTCSLVFNCLTNNTLLARKDPFKPGKKLTRGSSKLQLIEEARAHEALLQQLEASSPTYELQPSPSITPTPPAPSLPSASSTRPPSASSRPPPTPSQWHAPAGVFGLASDDEALFKLIHPRGRRIPPSASSTPPPSASSRPPPSASSRPPPSASSRPPPLESQEEKAFALFDGDTGAGIGTGKKPITLSRDFSDLSQRLNNLELSPNRSIPPIPTGSEGDKSKGDDLIARIEKLSEPKKNKGKSDRPKTEEEELAEIMKRLDELPRASRSDSDEEISKERLDNATRTGGSKRRKKKPRRQTHKKKQKKTKKKTKKII